MQASTSIQVDRPPASDSNLPIDGSNDDQGFFEHVAGLCGPDHQEDLDQADFKFLVDFAICNITYTVYGELNRGTFFKVEKSGDGPKEKDQDEEEERIRQFDTKGKFRIAQLYPVVLRAVLGYYTHIADAYYTATIEQRRFNQVPIGLNDKAYAVVCQAIRQLVLEVMKNEQGEKADPLPPLEEEEGGEGSSDDLDSTD